MFVDRKFGTFKDIRKELEAPIEAPAVPAPAVPVADEAPQPVATGVDEWPDTASDAVAPEPAPKPVAKPRAKKAAAAPADGAKTKARKPAAKPGLKADAARPKVTRTKKVDL